MDIPIHSNSKITRPRIRLRFDTEQGYPVSARGARERRPTSSGRGSFLMGGVRRRRRRRRGDGGARGGLYSWQRGGRRGRLMLLLIRIVQVWPLVYPVRLKLMIDQVMLGLAPFPAHVALRPRLRGRPIRVDIFHVLSKVAR